MFVHYITLIKPTQKIAYLVLSYSMSFLSKIKIGPVSGQPKLFQRNCITTQLRLRLFFAALLISQLARQPMKQTIIPVFKAVINCSRMANFVYLFLNLMLLGFVCSQGKQFLRNMYWMVNEDMRDLKHINDFIFPDLVIPTESVSTTNKEVDNAGDTDWGSAKFNDWGESLFDKNILNQTLYSRSLSLHNLWLQKKCILCNRSHEIRTWKVPSKQLKMLRQNNW